MTISVIVPTYRRPDYLVRCLHSLINQFRKPNQVLVVMRSDDIETHETYNEFVKSIKQENLVFFGYLVTEAGHLPPLVEGLKHATGDIIAVTDDDAEPYPDWLQRIEKYYNDPTVGGVGGRVENFIDNKKCDYKAAKIVGKVSWYGNVIGNMYKDSFFSKPVEVDFFMGGNTSFRRVVWNQITFDMNLNPYVAYNYEIDIGLQTKALGWRLIFDQNIKIRHYPNTLRDYANPHIDKDFGYIYFACCNLTYIMLKHLKWYGKVAFLLYEFLIGHRQNWGLATIILDPLLTGRIRWRGQLLTSLRGRVSGIRLYMQNSRFCCKNL